MCLTLVNSAWLWQRGSVVFIAGALVGALITLIITNKRSK